MQIQVPIAGSFISGWNLFESLQCHWVGLREEHLQKKHMDFTFFYMIEPWFFYEFPINCRWFLDFFLRCGPKLMCGWLMPPKPADMWDQPTSSTQNPRSDALDLYGWLQLIQSNYGHVWFNYLNLIWVNYNISLTWIKAILGWFPLLTMIPVRSQWGRYNLPRFNHIENLFFEYMNMIAPGFGDRSRIKPPLALSE